MNKTVIYASVMLFLCGSGLYCSHVQAEDHPQHRHTAHEHGVAQLNIARDGDTLQLELNSPAMNIVGFEHTPRDDRQRGAIKQAVATLQNGATLFALTPAASCRLFTAEVDSALLQVGHKHTATHADFEARYVFQCQPGAALHDIEVKLFTRFPGIQELAVQLLTEQGQRALHLTAAQPRLQLNK